MDPKAKKMRFRVNSVYVQITDSNLKSLLSKVYKEVTYHFSCRA